jgi:uncharacterized repeat protein (TIGR01451 family)/LPXTG-motif cell wall-anchored protein
MDRRSARAAKRRVAWCGLLALLLALATGTSRAAAAIPSADLSVAMTADTTTPVTGDPVTITVTVTNLGPDTATGVVIGDSLPAGLSYQSIPAGASHGSFNTGNGVWTVGTLAPGAQADLQLFVTFVGPAPATNVANVSGGDQGDPDNSNDAAQVTFSRQNADLALHMSVSDDTPAVGDSVLFTLTVHDNGPDTATSVEVTAALPSGLLFQQSVASQGTYGLFGGRWDIGTLPVGSIASLQVQATATTDDPITFEARASANGRVDTDTGNDVSSVTLNPKSTSTTTSSTTTTSSPTTTRPTSSVTSRPTSSSPSSSSPSSTPTGSSSELPRTGTDPAVHVALGIASLLAGGTLAFLARRRRRQAPRGS